MYANKQTPLASTLRSFCQNDPSLQTKIALMTFYNKRYSKWTEKTILLFEYLQLISLSLLFHASNNNETDSTNSFLSNTVLYFFKLVNPSCLMPLNVHNSLSSTILIIVFSFMMLKYLLFLYIIGIAYWDYRGNSLLLTLWQWIYRTQTRILCFFLTSFWSAVIIGSSEETFQVKGICRPVLIGLCCLLILIEYSFSFYIEIQLNYVLPTENFLSAKTPITQITTLFQKFVLQIIQIGFHSHSQAGAWIFCGSNVILTSIKTYQCLDKFIQYSIKTLFWQIKLQSIVISLNLACLAETLLDSLQYQEADTNFTIIVWFLLTILMSKAFEEVLAKRIINTINIQFGKSHPEPGPELLMHKVHIIQELRRNRKIPSKNAKKIDYSHLFSSGVEGMDNESIFCFESEPCSKTNQTDNDENIFVRYLANLSVKFHTNILVKLNLAQVCLKDPKFYLRALQIAADLAHSKWSMSSVTASLLILEIEKIILSSQQNNQSTLNLFAYIKSEVFVKDIETKMKKQIELKIQICKNILGETVRIGQIFNFAQQVDKYKQQTQKEILLLSSTVPDYYVEPFLLIAGYYLILEHSQQNFQKYIDICTQKQIKYDKYFENSTLTKENLFQANNILMMISGEKTNYGQIIFCSDSIHNVCGGKIESYKGSDISTLFIPSFRSYYHDLFKQIFETEENTLLNRIQRAFLSHKDGYISEVEFYLTIHPYLTQGLYLSVIVRPTKSSKDYLLIKEDGSIEGATKGIAQNLCLNRSSHSPSTLLNVKVLSEELWKVNQAFSIVAKANREKDALKYEKALKLVNSYTSESRKLELITTDRNNRSYQYYDCKISPLSYGLSGIKIYEFVKLDADLEIGYIDMSLYGSGRREHILDTFKITGQQENDNNVLSQSEDADCDENVQKNQMTTEWKATTEVNLNTVADLPSPTGQRLLPKRYEERNFENDKAPSYIALQGNPLSQVKKVTNKRGVLINESQLDFLSSTQAPDISNSKSTNRTFHSAIAINFHPKSFRAICLVFYGVIFITLFSQVVLKIVSDQTLEELFVKTTLLSVSQLRTFRSILISINCRGNLDNILMPTLNNGQTYTGMAQTVKNMQGHEAYLMAYNDQLIHNLHLLDDDIKQNLFLKDIRVTGSYIDSDNPNYRNVTAFEMIDEVVDTIHRLGPLTKNPELLYSNQSYHLHNFIWRNILNDFLFKSQEISEIFIGSVRKEKDHFESIITLGLIVTPLLLIGIVFMLILIICKQYNIEKRHMLAFVRLKPASVIEIMKRLIVFKEKVADRDPLEFKKWLESVEDAVSTAQNEHHQENIYHKKYESQVIETSITRIRYTRYVVRVAFYILILIGVTLFNFISAQQSANVIYRRQSQIEFANHLSELTGVLYSANGALFEANNTYPVRDNFANISMINGLVELTSMITQIPTAFREEDGSYDPTIENMMFHYTSCDSYNFIPLHLYFCNFMVTHGAQITLLPLVTVFRNLVQEKILDYNNCDKSTLASLFTCVYFNVDSWLPSFVLSAIEAQKIGDVATSNLDRSISDAYYQRKVFLIVFSVSLAIVSLLIWMQVLKKLRDTYNDFKKVLHVFPPYLILSSFLLKNFLMQRVKDIQY